jgi:uncharacterized protein YndB with AHSA1/START domain
MWQFYNMSADDTLTELSFSVAARVSRPVAEVYEAVADPDQLSRYFTTGGARGRLEPGAEVTWDFADFPGRFPVTVVEADPPSRIVIEWGADDGTTTSGTTRTTFTFEEAEPGRTLVTVRESLWLPTASGSAAAFGNCEGWTQMVSALKIWVEHGINLREGYYR